MVGISAGAILGDGSVALILDVAGLMEAGGQWRPLVATLSS
jgi:chemotaxis protein histidine kinase CheA